MMCLHITQQVKFEGSSILDGLKQLIASDTHTDTLPAHIAELASLQSHTILLKDTDADDFAVPSTALRARKRRSYMSTPTHAATSATDPLVIV
jgi:hypothetical protein